jgi:F-type H+-transporting ATPase subunit a
MASPMEQFQIKKVVDLPDFTIPGTDITVDMAITNSSLAMFVAAGLLILFFALLTASPKVVPGKFQVIGEGVFTFIDDLSTSVIGHDGRKYFPFIFTMFTFVLSMNLLGLIPGNFTATSQLAVTVTLALLVFIPVLVIGFWKHGIGFFKLFIPSGLPWPMIPILFVIELFSFLLRPVTLSLRLFGNMLGGHVALKVFAGFIVALGSMAFAGGFGLHNLGIAGAVLSMGGVVALTALEILVACLQAFVFAILTTIYLNDAVTAGAGH